VGTALRHDLPIPEKLIMSIQIKIIDIDFILVTLDGVLAHHDLVSFQRALTEQLSGGEKASILVDAREFEGWEKDGDWGDVEAQYVMDPLILKMAIVTDSKWKDLATAFTGKGLRSFPIEIYSPTDYDKAQEWLSQASA
jgi:hypothetical protein